MLKQKVKSIQQWMRWKLQGEKLTRKPYYLGRAVKIAKSCKVSEMVELFDYVVLLDNVAIGGYTSVNKSTVVASGTIGRYCSIGQDCIIGGGGHDLDAVSTSQLMLGLLGCGEERLYNPYEKPPKIGNDVWIAAKVIVLQGVNIGDGAVIASGAVVTKDVPKYAIVAGNPAKVIRYRFSNENIEYLTQWKWWKKEIKDFTKKELTTISAGRNWNKRVSSSSKCNTIK